MQKPNQKRNPTVYDSPKEPGTQLKTIGQPHGPCVLGAKCCLASPMASFGCRRPGTPSRAKRAQLPIFNLNRQGSMLELASCR